MTRLNRVIIEAEECKGCGFCIHACPAGVLEFSKDLNAMGYHYATYKGEGCTGCGSCFYTCPETGAITVVRNVEGLEEAYCPSCDKTVKVIPASRKEMPPRCIECRKPIK